MDPRRYRIVEGALFTIGLAGAGALLIAAGAGESSSIDARWWTRVLPIPVLALFWSVCLGEGELRRRTEWPLLFRYPIEIAAIMLALALGYLIGRHHLDHHFWQILGGSLAAIASGLRGYLITERRGELLDQALGALSNYVRSRHWRPRPKP